MMNDIFRWYLLLMPLLMTVGNERSLSSDKHTLKSFDSVNLVIFSLEL